MRMANITKARVVKKGGKVALQPVAQLRLVVHLIVQGYYMQWGVLFLFISSFFFITGVIIAINALKQSGNPFCLQNNIPNPSAE